MGGGENISECLTMKRGLAESRSVGKVSKIIHSLEMHTDWSHEMSRWQFDIIVITATSLSKGKHLPPGGTMNTSVFDSPPSPTQWRIRQHVSPSFKPSFPLQTGFNYRSQSVPSYSLSAYPLTTRTEGEMHAWPNYSVGEKYLEKGKNHVEPAM